MIFMFQPFTVGVYNLESLMLDEAFEKMSFPKEVTWVSNPISHKSHWTAASCSKKSNWTLNWCQVYMPHSPMAITTAIFNGKVAKKCRSSVGPAHDWSIIYQSISLHQSIHAMESNPQHENQFSLISITIKAIHSTPIPKLVQQKCVWEWIDMEIMDSNRLLELVSHSYASHLEIPGPVR